MPHKIQPQEHSRGGGMGGALHVTDSDGDLNVFNVEHNSDGRWLNGNNGKPDNFWDAGFRWVFARRNALHFSPIFIDG